MAEPAAGPRLPGSVRDAINVKIRVLLTIL